MDEAPVCDRCGAGIDGERRDPTVGLGMAALGVLVLADGLRGVWSRGLDSIHAVIGLGLLGAASWGMGMDWFASRRAGARPEASLWIEARPRCRHCGATVPGARDLSWIRGLLLVAAVAFALAMVGRKLAG